MSIIADKVINKPAIIQGFKVWGIKLPFTCKSLRTDVVLELAGLSTKLQKDEKGNYDLPTSLPILAEYISIGLNNKRSWLLQHIFKRQVLKLPQEELIYLYQQVKALWNPALFFCLLEEVRQMESLLLHPQTSPNMEGTASGEP